MTDNELKFFDPETGAELPRVPRGGVITKRTPYGYVRPDGVRGWVDSGRPDDLEQGDGTARFTREPVAPPKPSLPTEPGATIRAVHQSGNECAVMVRGRLGYWHGVDQDGDERFWGDESITSWDPITVTPTETWDRLRVLDPEDKRGRADRDGNVWDYYGDGRWKNGTRTCIDLGALHRHYGPLRFADEVTDR